MHRRLYQSDDITRFDIGAFTENLVADVIGASGRKGIATQVHVEPIEIRSSSAAPLGLILNELLTNALKHAYVDGRDGTLKVSACRTGDQAEIVIGDDGPGLTTGVPTGGLGAALIERLSRQAGAKVLWESGDPGTRVRVVFRIDSE